MIAQFVKRSLLLIALFCMASALALTGVIAHPVDVPVVACDGLSRTPDEIAALAPGDGTPYVSRERERVERVDEANPEDVAAIAETVAGWTACMQGGDTARAAAFLTDAAIASGYFVLTDDEPESETEDLLLGVIGAWELSDGRIAALIAFDSPDEAFPVNSMVLICANVDGVWLIDDLSV